MTLTRARTIQYVGILFALALIAVGYWYWSARAGVKSNTSALQPQGTGRLDSGLVGYWKLDENTGTSAADASTNGNTGTLTNGPTWITGQIGSGVQFDGTNDHISAGTSSSLVLTDKRTLAAWVYISGSMVNGDTYYIARKYSSGDANSYYGMYLFHNGTGTTLGSYGGGGGAFTNSTGYLAAGQWYHVAVAFDKPTVSFYINGRLDSTATDTIGGGYPSGSGTMYIGSAGGSSHLNGRLDEVRAYDRTLSADEVGQLYRLTSPTSVDTSLKAYWSFDGQDMNGTSAYDRSGAGNNGTLTNGPAPRKGVAGQALNFDGSNDSIVSAADSPALAGLTQASIAFWINPRGASYQGGIFSTLAGDGGGNGAFSNGFMVSGDLWAGTQTIRFVADGSTGDMQTRSTSVLPLNSWTHVVVVWDGSLTAADTKFYINGVLDKTVGMISGSGSFVPSNGNFKIGRMDGSNTLDGLLDELRVYNRVLTAAEAKGLYDIAKPDATNSSSSQAQGVGQLDSGLSAYFRFDDGTSGATPTTAADSSVNGLTAGTLTNGPTWTTGQIGSAVAFDGTNDSVYVASATAFDIALGEKVTTAFWYTANQADGTAAGVYDAASAFGGCAHNQVALSGGASTDILNFYYRTDNCNGINAVQITGVSKNVWHHVVSTYDSSTGAFAAYLDGTLKATATAALDINMNLTDLNIGGGGGQYLLGSVDEFRFYRRVLSSDEVGALYRLTSPTSIDTSLKGYWSFNGQDMSGTTAYDRSGAGNNGTLTGGPTTSKGIVGQGLLLDGVNDVVQLLSDAPNITGALTASFWLKTTATSQKTILGFWQTTGWTVQLDGDGSAPGKLSFYSNNSGFKHASTAVNDGAWHHVAFTLTSGGVLTMYRDGAVDGSYTSVPLPGSYTDDKFFSSIPGGGGYFPGTLDEIRIYNRALTVAEIQGQYDSAKPDKTNSSVSTPQGTGRLDSGLTGYWKLDENTGTSTVDASTNGGTGTLTNGPTWMVGQIGSAVDFDGTNDTLSVGSDSALNITDKSLTISAWIYPQGITTTPSYHQAIFDRWDHGCTGLGYSFNISNHYLVGNPTQLIFNENCGGTHQTVATGLVNNAWQHVVVSVTNGAVKFYVNGSVVANYVGGTASNPLSYGGPAYIGNGPGAAYPFNGGIDEVRVYNRGLSAEEVSQLYRLNAPTGTDTSLKGYWSFNGQDMTATTAYDRSGSAINGTLAGNARAVRGKLGQALSLDGTGDYVNLGNTLELGLPMTVSGWINLSAYPASAGGILTTDKTNPGDHYHSGMWFQVASNGVLGVNYGDNTNCNADGRRSYTGTRVLALNTWYHVTAIVSGPTDMKLYIDGVEDIGTYDSFGTGGAIAYAAYSAAIGRVTDCPSGSGLDFPGKIDEVRIYNRALSATEVQTMYKQNK